MNKYLLEVGTEELAHKFIPPAMEQLRNGFSAALKANQIGFSDIKVYATPRRLAVIIEDIAEKQPDIEKVIKGPVKSIAYDKDGNFTQAALGFAAKNGIDTSALFIRDNYIHAKIEQKGRSTKEILPNIIPSIVLNLKGTHFMRWGNSDIKFQRPIRWIVSLFNEEQVEIEIAEIKSSNVSRGHRFSKSQVVIKHPDEYLKTLESADVTADVQTRKNTVIKLAKEKAAEIGADIVMDENLLNEVTFITEWPIPVICSFDEKYLQLPEKVAVTVMAVHQKYFPLYKEGRLLNKFITISNYTGSNFDNIRAGNERVVKARLEDAVFFMREDMQKPLISYVDDLKGVTFQKGFGSLYDKTQRICTLSKAMAKELNVHSVTIERTALLCKADLVTKLVIEFTELQGYIGSAYALNCDEAPEVAKGIMEHYMPLNAESEPAESIEGQITGIADKMDTVAAVFADGKKISGSQDPLGVRRAVLGILKTVIQKDLNINLSDLIKKSIDLLPVQIDDKYKLFNTIKEFFEQRLIILLSDKYKYDVIEACLSGKDALSCLTDFINRLNTVSKIKQSENYGQFHEAANRIIRLIKNETDFSAVNEKLLENEAEKKLWTAVKNIDECPLSYSEFQEKLFQIIPYITEFFEKVLVMDKDENIKQNRLSLLYFIKRQFEKIADFSKIKF